MLYSIKIKLTFHCSHSSIIALEVKGKERQPLLHQT